MQPANNYRYTITDRLGNLIAQPLGESDFSIDWERETDTGKRQYKKEFGGNITFTGAAYMRLLKLETSIYRCEFQNVTVERSCTASGAQEWELWFNGQISLNEGEWDLDGCKVVCKFEENKPDKCFDDNKNTKVNLLQQIFTRKTVRMFPGNVTLEFETCTRNVPEESGERGYYWCGDGDPYEKGWVVYKHSESSDFIHDIEIRTDWARQVMVISCAITPSPDWILISDDCVGSSTRTYARPVNIYNCVYQNDPNPETNFYSYECQIFGQGGSATEFDNGMLLNDIIKVFIQMFCPDLTVKSDFFQINPENVSTVNYVTGLASKVLNIVVYQKSDVKRPLATGNASRAEWTFEKLMTTLKYMFNVDWRVEGNLFVLEHVSFYSKNIGFNFTLPQFAKWVKGKRKYSYKNESIPKREHWTWKEQTYYGDFPGVDIIYDDGCVTTGSKDTTENYAVEDVMTDVEYAISNSAADNKNVSDDGFVFIATDFDGTTYSIITEAGILEGAKINNSLGFAQLQRDYHRHERPLLVGNMNNAVTQFLSVIPSKKGEKFSVPFCCGMDFNPDDLIVTHLGNGTVDKATFKFKGSTIEFDLLYPATGGLTDNDKPVAVNDTATTYMDEEKIINVLANDSDPDPDATVQSVEIVLQPTHGVALVMPDKTVKYTPTASYVGDDYFVYRYKDNWGEPSNNALVAITVHPANMPPVATNKTYTVYDGLTLNVAAPGVFTGDTDDVGFVLDAYDAVGTSGGTVVVNSNGSFSYTPPALFFGDDTFTYRIKDEKGATATATITIKSRRSTYPVANPDEYQTTVNTSLGVTGAFPNPKLTANDTTPAGGTPTYTTTPESKATTQGGAVVIYADGTFDYVPPSTFIGKDTFTYEVSNGAGTDIGTVTINVMPNIYVRMDREDYKYTPITINCGGFMQPGGEQETSDYRLSFYSNPGGTVPFDVAGLGLKVSLNQGYRNTSGGSYTYYNWQSGVLSGNTVILQDDFFDRIEELDCSGTPASYYEQVLSLIAGNGYTVI